MDNLFVQTSLLLTIAVAAAFIIRLLKQPLIVSYIFAGIICGPLILNILHGDHQFYETFAQFGIVLLLFIIGLNLNFNHLKSIGKISFITGLGQVLFTAVFGTIILLALNFKLQAAAYLAIAMTFSSTIIIMKMLSDKKDTETIYGRYTIGLMLVQDVIAVFLVIVLGFMGGNHASGWETILILVLKLLVAVLVLYLLSKYVVPPILDKIADSSELLFLFTLTWCFAIASSLYLLGFSLEIGAIISGIALSSSPYQLEIASRIKPLRDFFIILFFIVLGGEMLIGQISQVFWPSLILSLFILVGNPLILYFLFRRMKFTRRNSFMAGLTAAQVSEFGFVILFAARQMGYIQGNELAVFTFVAITTILGSTYMISHSEQLYRYFLPFFRYFGPDKYRQTNKMAKTYDAWLIGYHRIGTKIAESLIDSKTKFAVIDYDPGVVKNLQKSKIPLYFGDIADLEFVESIPIGNTKIIVMTIPAVDDQINLIKFVRKINPKVLIIANAYRFQDSKDLYENGAHFVMMPHYLSGHWMAKTLHNKKLNRKTLQSLRVEQEAILALK